MTTAEHLNAIAAKCNQLIELETEGWTNSPFREQAIAGWRSTIAAIERTVKLRDSLIVGPDRVQTWDACNSILRDILAAWPPSLL